MCPDLSTVVDVAVGLVWIVVVQHGAQATEEVRVDKLAGALPPKVGVVEVIVLV